MGRLANLLHSIGVYLVTLVIGSSLCARGLDRDSFESSETRVGLVNQPEYGPLLYSFSLLLLLISWFWLWLDIFGRILVGRDHIWSRQWILVLRSC